MARGLDPVRVARVEAALSGGDREPADSLCSAAAMVLGVAGAGIVLWSRGRQLGNVCVSDPRTESVEDVQYTLGQGPCVDAFAARAPIEAEDLADPAEIRWPQFRRAVLAAGLRSAFGFPLLVGSVCLGTLNLYQDLPGALSAEQFADAAAVAYIAGRTLLSWQMAAGRRALPWQLDEVPKHRAVLHQATGMVSVQATLSVNDALALLRAYAYAEDRPIGEVAANVVAGRLRLED